MSTTRGAGSSIVFGSGRRWAQRARGAIVEELYDHTIDVILRAEPIGGWRAVASSICSTSNTGISSRRSCARRARRGLRREVVVVTGPHRASQGLRRGVLEARRGGGGLRSQPGDRTDVAAPRFSGNCLRPDRSCGGKQRSRPVGKNLWRVDMLVLNGGISLLPAAAGNRSGILKQTMTVNVEAPLRLLQQCHPLLKVAPHGGRSCHRIEERACAGTRRRRLFGVQAALNQLARVAALEGAKDGIRINSLHPDAVYDTGLWTPELLAARAKAYNLSVEQYGEEPPQDRSFVQGCRELAAEMCGRFSPRPPPPGAVDGGNERVV